MSGLCLNRGRQRAVAGQVRSIRQLGRRDLSESVGPNGQRQPVLVQREMESRPFPIRH